jgi:hypothetical protein
MGEVPVKTKKTVTLRDAGFGLLFIFILGVPFGFILDYLWNRVVIYLTLNYLIKPTVSMWTLDRTWSYAVFVTIIGLLIDWGYYVIIWDSGWEPAMGLASQLALILPVIILLLAANMILCIKYLKLGRRQAIITSSVMAVLTAPWIIPIVPHAAGWVSVS